jgi:tRNA-splicing ligase RtcB (3'-phosphate/5'-hydroxy nucleic acid ligase)
MSAAANMQTTWKSCAIWDARGFFDLRTPDTGEVPVRLFLTQGLLTELEPQIYQQIVNATRFPGAKLVVITPDAHVGYGVPVGSVILTDRASGALAMGPVGFDIGCGMVSAKSCVPFERATYDRKLEFHKQVMKHVDLGAGGLSKRFGELSTTAFQDLVRGGAEHYVSAYGGEVDRSMAERHRIPVEDAWEIPWGGPGKPERGKAQLGSLGGGNHFIELQKCEEDGMLYLQVHTGSRGFGHGLATNYFAMAKDEHPERGADLDLGYFTPDSPHYRGYQNAVAAGGNFAIVNRLVITAAVAEAFRKVFREDLTLIYEISHNLVQEEHHPEFGHVWAHRKGATRAFPAGHPELTGTRWAHTGHPVLIPGSNRDYSYVLTPGAQAHLSAYSVNHGAGRRMSRGEAVRILSQEKVNEQYARDHILVNLDGEVPLDEASACYKPSRTVIEAVVGAGLASIDQTLWPLGSLKGSDSAIRVKKRNRRGLERSRDQERGDARRQKRENH